MASDGFGKIRQFQAIPIKTLLEIGRCEFDIGFDHASVIEDYLNHIPREFDFRVELKMQQRIRESLLKRQAVDDRLQDLYIPRPYESLSDENVLVMEYVDGVSVVDTREMSQA